MIEWMNLCKKNIEIEKDNIRTIGFISLSLISIKLIKLKDYAKYLLIYDSIIMIYSKMIYYKHYLNWSAMLGVKEIKEKTNNGN